MTLEDTVLAMTVAVVEVARIGRDALIGELVSGGLTEDEARAVVDEVIQVKLAPTARKARVQQLHESGMSQRAIAAELGVGRGTVERDLGPNGPLETDDHVPEATDSGPLGPPDQEDTTQKETPLAVVPEEESESGGPQWEVLLDIRNQLNALAAFPPKAVAAQVPARRRAATARELRRLGTTLARVVLALEAPGDTMP